MVVRENRQDQVEGLRGRTSSGMTRSSSSAAPLLLAEDEEIVLSTAERSSEQKAASRESDPLFIAANAVLAEVGQEVGLRDEEVRPYINALRIVHGDDNEMVAAYDRGRLTESGAVRYARARLRRCPTDRNLVTVEEFASLIAASPSSVWELIKLGLPSRKITKVGRRILKAQAEAWLVAGGAEKAASKGGRRGR